MWIYNPTKEKYEIVWGGEHVTIAPNGISEIPKEVAQKYFLKFLPEAALNPDNLEGLMKHALRFFGKSYRKEEDREFLDQFKVASKREELEKYLASLSNNLKKV